MDVVFDLNGTLLDPGALALPWGADRALGLRALDDAVAQAMVDTLTGVFRGFPELLRGGLARQVALAELDPALLDEAAERARALPPYPEAAQALDLLAEGGARLSVLTNSAADAARGALAEAALLDRFARIDGADAARAYKPDPRVYALHPPTDGAWFVAGHWWDTTGAARAGYRTAWISRDDVVRPSAAPAPDVEAPDLLAAARAILDAG